MVKTEREIKEIIDKFKLEVERLGVKSEKLILYGSYARGNPKEESDIDLVVISDDFRNMNIRERLELLGIAAGRVFEPIEALGYTEEEIEREKKGTFLEEIFESGKQVALT